MSKKIVSCNTCRYFKYQYVSFINTEHIEGDRHNTHVISSDMSDEEKEQVRKNHEISHHEIIAPSGCCNPKIQMCQHPACFTLVGSALAGMPCSMETRTQGQAQLNKYGKCKHHKRKLLSIGR